MKGKRCILGTLLVLSLAGCKIQDQATPKSMLDGAHNITKSMRGFWDSPGGSGCKWRKYDRYRNPTGHGGGTRSQTVLFGSSDVGGTFRSDRCKRWSPK